MNLTNLKIQFESVDYPIDLGFKGEEFLEAGYVYAPYIPMMETVQVEGEVRNLRASWTPEMAQDVHAFHGIDAERELTAILSEQIAAEIDREILNEIQTRYAKKPVNPNYYQKITIGDCYSDTPSDSTPTIDFLNSSDEIKIRSYSGGINLL